MQTNPIFSILAATLLFAPLASAGSRSSASYTVPADVTDSGGLRATSASYRNDNSVGGITGISTVTSPAETSKSGYLAELYEVVGFVVSAAAPSVNEGSSLQLLPFELLDDASYLSVNPNQVTWGAAVTPISAISANGVATAQIVYQDTPASVQGTFQSSTAFFNFTVLNITNDDFGCYAGDGIDDSWQVQYFGQPPNPLAGPGADADGTGQTNLFKFVAGLNPLDGSRFLLSIQAVPGQASQKQVIFNPIIGGRTYSVQSTTNPVTPAWLALPQSNQSDNGNVRTVTDLSALPAPRFYRVQITKP